MLDLRRLRLLRELHRRRTIAAVADALQYTPSAVSQQPSARRACRAWRRATSTDRGPARGRRGPPHRGADENRRIFAAIQSTDGARPSAGALLDAMRKAVSLHRVNLGEPDHPPG